MGMGGWEWGKGERVGERVRRVRVGGGRVVNGVGMVWGVMWDGGKGRWGGKMGRFWGGIIF